MGIGLASDPKSTSTSTSTLLQVGILADLIDAAAALLIRDRIPEKNFRTGFGGGSLYAVIGAVIALIGRDGIHGMGLFAA